MKFLFVLIAVAALGSVGLATPLKVEERGLAEDWQELLELLPLEGIVKVIFDYAEDDEFVQLLVYIFDGELAELILEIESIPEYNAVITLIENAGLPIKSWIAQIHELLGIPNKTSWEESKIAKMGGIRAKMGGIRANMGGIRANMGGISAIMGELRALINMEELTAWFNDKLVTSPELASLYEQLTSPAFKAFLEALQASERVQEILAQLNIDGADTEAIFLGVLVIVMVLTVG